MRATPEKTCCLDSEPFKCCDFLWTFFLRAFSFLAFLPWLLYIFKERKILILTLVEILNIYIACINIIIITCSYKYPSLQLKYVSFFCHAYTIFLVTYALETLVQITLSWYIYMCDSVCMNYCQHCIKYDIENWFIRHPFSQHPPLQWLP